MDLSLRGMGLGMLVRRLTRTEETSVEVWVFSVVSDGSQQLLSLSLTPLNINRYGHYHKKCYVCLQHEVYEGKHAPRTCVY